MVGGVPRIGGDVVVAAPTACRLGEGPCWFADEGALRFVDIKGGRIHSYRDADGGVTSQAFDGEPSFILPRRGGGALVGSRRALFATASDGSQAHRLAALPFGAEDRSNDAAVAPDGAVWLGSMHDPEERATGAIWRWHGDEAQRAWGSTIVTNGPAVSADGTLLYWVDTSRAHVWHARIGEGHALHEAAVLFSIEEGAGWPDGVVLDEEGCLWLALWDGWAVRRYAPDGRLIGSLAIPCARPTKLCFGGPGRGRAFVTSARIGLSDTELARQPHAGALFAFDPGVRGPELPLAR